MKECLKLWQFENFKIFIEKNIKENNLVFGYWFFKIVKLYLINHPTNIVTILLFYFLFHITYKMILLKIFIIILIN